MRLGPLALCPETAYPALVDILDFDDNQPLILVTNDDGIRSPGLYATAEAVADLGNVLVAAPTEQQTARGRSLVGNRADHFHPVSFAVGTRELPAFHLDASPALVVRHALAVLCAHRRPDLVVSGINYGENLGSNITISGTVGAALQAASAGIPALAISRETEIEHHYVYGDLDWEEPIRVTRRYAERLLVLTAQGRPLPFDFLKIDVPNGCPPGTEERITRLSREHYFHSEISNPRVDTPIAAAVTTVAVDPARLAPDDDIYAFAVDGVVSVTPLNLDCTTSLDRAREVLQAAGPGGTSG